MFIGHLYFPLFELRFIFFDFSSVFFIFFLLSVCIDSVLWPFVSYLANIPQCVTWLLFLIFSCFNLKQNAFMTSAGLPSSKNACDPWIKKVPTGQKATEEGARGPWAWLPEQGAPACPPRTSAVCVAPQRVCLELWGLRAHIPARIIMMQSYKHPGFLSCLNVPEIHLQEPKDK